MRPRQVSRLEAPGAHDTRYLAQVTDADVTMRLRAAFRVTEDAADERGLSSSR